MGALVLLLVGCVLLAGTAGGADVRVRQEQKGRGVRKHSPVQVALEVNQKGEVSSSTTTGSNKFHLLWTDLMIKRYATQYMGTRFAAILLAGACYEGTVQNCPQSHLSSDGTFTLPTRTGSQPELIVTYATTRYSDHENCRLKESANVIAGLLGMDVAQTSTSGKDISLATDGYCPDGDYWAASNWDHHGVYSFDMASATNLSNYVPSTTVWNASDIFTRNKASLETVISTSVDVHANGASSASSHYGSHWAFENGYNGNAAHLALSNQGFADHNKLLTAYKDGLSAAQACDMVRLRKQVFGLSSQSDVVVICADGILGASCRTAYGTCAENKMIVFDGTDKEGTGVPIESWTFNDVFPQDTTNWPNAADASAVLRQAKYVISAFVAYNHAIMYQLTSATVPQVTHLELGVLCGYSEPGDHDPARPRKVGVTVICGHTDATVATTPGEMSESVKDDFHQKLADMAPLLEKSTGSISKTTAAAEHDTAQYYYNTMTRLLKIVSNMNQPISSTNLKQDWDAAKATGTYAWNALGGTYSFKFADAAGKIGNKLYKLTCTGTSATCTCADDVLKCDGTSTPDDLDGPEAAQTAALLEDVHILSDNAHRNDGVGAIDVPETTEAN